MDRKKLHNSALKLEQAQSIESAKGLKRFTDSKATLMVMAIYLDTDMRQAVTWNQLDYFTEKFDHIIISAPIQFMETVTLFIEEVKENMPVIDKRL